MVRGWASVPTQVLAVLVRDTGLNSGMESSPINHVHDACMRAASSLLMHGVVSASDLCACMHSSHVCERTIDVSSCKYGCLLRVGLPHAPRLETVIRSGVGVNSPTIDSLA